MDNLTKLCRKWQRRLRLVDWKITIIPQTEEQLVDCLGTIPNDPSELTATILLRMPQDDPEATLIHELLHLRMLPWSDGEETEPNHAERERALNVMADTYKMAYASDDRRRR